MLFTVAMRAQIQDPVKFKSELKILAADEAEGVFTEMGIRDRHKGILRELNKAI